MEKYLILFYIWNLIVEFNNSTSEYYSMIKEIDGILYIGGRNSLSAYKFINDEQIEFITKEVYEKYFTKTNESYIGYKYSSLDFPGEISGNPSSMAFDACLHWKQDHVSASNRNSSFDYHHSQYHTPSGQWNTSNYLCTNSFIRSIELFDDILWVCGTFSSFPRAFTVNKTSLKFIKFVDVNLMSCARYIDEPMATHRDKSGNLYVASGWGLYRPDKKNPDVPNNNSTMLYADWRLFRNLFTLPAAMAWVLSSDVNFINVVKENKNHLYFFGHEINNQYGLNNQEDRHAWQSFMLRICKNDLGFKYVPQDISSLLKHMSSTKYYIGTINGADYTLSPIHEDVSYNPDWYHNTAHLPTKHFVNSQKINFGCYIGKRPRAISDNYFWGDTNVVYLNKLADVIFNPNRSIKFKTKNNNDYFGCTDKLHEQVPLIGIFNSPGIKGTAMNPTGALCQLQINANIFNEIGSNKKPYHKSNLLDVTNAYDEIMSLNSISVSNFYSRSLHRTNGFTLYPYWNQGVLIGDSKDRPYYKNVFDDIGKCQNSSFYENMDKNKFLKIQNFSNTAWPNELPNRLSSIPSAICQFSAVELYSFNATFVISGVEFKKMFLLAENITNYYMPKLKNESDEERRRRREMSPLLLLVIISNTGMFYRVVICDFDSGMENHGKNKSTNEWYNWCIFRHTDQPYLYRQYAPMEKRERGETNQYRASSLLLEKSIIKKNESILSSINGDPQFHTIKDVLRKGNTLYVLTANKIETVDIQINCASYDKCINCASDPLCMWSITDHKCMNYVEKNFTLSLFIQDVLDRGFKCYVIVKDKPSIINATNLLLLNCSNGDYWRGPITWRINGTKINSNMNKEIYLHKDNRIMTISTDALQKYKTNISCHGIRDDHDKLFGGMEYDGLTEFSEIRLNTFHIKQLKPVPIYWNWIDITLIIFLAIMIALVVIIGFIHYSSKKCKNVRSTFPGNFNCMFYITRKF